MLDRLLIIVAAFCVALSPGAEESGGRNAWSLYQKVLSENKGNVAFAPLGMQRSAGLLYLGARGEAAAALARAFEFPEPSLYVSQAAKDREGLLELRKSVQWESALGLFAPSSLPLVPEFVQLAAATFDAQVLSKPAEASAAAQRINAWCSAQTHGMIAEVVKVEDIQPGGLLLCDTMYLQARWKNEFKKAGTRTAPFFRDKQQTYTHMMYSGREAHYSQTKNWQMVELPYRGDRLVFDALLPKATRGSCPPIGWEEFQAVQKKAYFTPLDLYLPRFKVRSKLDLLSLLRKLGLPQVCDFSGICAGPAEIQSMKQDAWVQVDEEGAKAAAVTQTGMIWVAVKEPPPVPEFRADHPFLFVIRDRETGAILFCGQVEEPEVSTDPYESTDWTDQFRAHPVKSNPKSKPKSKPKP